MHGDGDVFDIRFPTGWSARAVIVPPDEDGGTLLDRLGVTQARGVLSVTGGTAAGTETPALADVFVGGIGTTIIDQGWVAVTGATDAGIFTLLGRAAERAGRLGAPWIGVAPLARVRWPGGPARTESESYALEPHHSHLVLVDGREWGDEVPAQLAIPAALGRSGARTAVVVAGGGDIARREIVGHVAAQRPILVLKGSGRLADQLALAKEAGAADDDELMDIVGRGRIVVCDLGEGPAPARAALIDLLGT